MVVVALRIERVAVGGAVVVTGMGPRRAAGAAARLARTLAPGTPVVMTGVCGAVDAAVRPGTVVVADRVGLGHDVPAPLPGAEAMCRALVAAGLAPVVGRLSTVDRMVRGAERDRLAAAGVLAVDMESAVVVEALRADGHRPVAVVRTVSDTPGTGVVRGGVPALVALRRLRPAFEAWAEAVR